MDQKRKTTWSNTEDSNQLIINAKKKKRASRTDDAWLQCKAIPWVTKVIWEMGDYYKKHGTKQTDSGSAQRLIKRPFCVEAWRGTPRQRLRTIPLVTVVCFCYVTSRGLQQRSEGELTGWSWWCPHPGTRWCRCHWWRVRRLLCVSQTWPRMRAGVEICMQKIFNSPANHEEEPCAGPTWPLHKSKAKTEVCVQSSPVTSRCSGGGSWCSPVLIQIAHYNAHFHCA